MTDEMRKQRQEEMKAALDEVQAAVYALLKPIGFRKHGRLFHRFVDGDVSQVVEFQRGQAYLEQTHLFWVNVGIRVPECALRTFSPEETAKYHREAECDLRYTLGEKSKKINGSYDLRKPVGPIIEDICAQLQRSVIPAFEALSSREAILVGRREYPQFYIGWLSPLMEAMIYGRRGELERAEELFNVYYHTCGNPRFPDVAEEHRKTLRELALRLGITIRPMDDNTPEA